MKLCQALVLATQEAEIRKITVQIQPRQTSHETYLENIKHTKKGLVLWLKLKALSSSPSTEKKKEVKL
jgi:hypothetical protein